MDVLQAIGAATQGFRLVKGLFPKQSSSEALPQKSFGEMLLRHQDRNGDGALSAQELKLSSSLFNQLDRNADGKLSLDELNSGSSLIQQALQSEKRIDQYIESHDADHNDLINEVESGMEHEIYSIVDRNADKQLNRSEIGMAIQGQSMDLST